MRELYVFVTDVQHAKILALILLCVAALGLLTWIWGNVHRSGLKVSLFQWIQIYVLGFIAFLSGVLVMGFMVTPKNADGLINLMMLDRLFMSYTKQVQDALIWIIKSLM